jgi:hypothetical protein
MPTYPPGAFNITTGARYKAGVITIPAWYDVIHLAPVPEYNSEQLSLMESIRIQQDVSGRPPQFSADFFNIPVSEVLSVLNNARDYEIDKARRLAQAQSIRDSPTPEIAQNFGVIMTALDDVQDFTTTVGVISRVLGRVFRPAELLAIGAFTVGEFLNRLTLMHLIEGQDKAIICRLVKNLKQSSRKTTIKADVAKRMKRLFPTHGELIEVLQTTDQLFGVGISLGPLVGLVQDAFFGAFANAPVRFKEWNITSRESAVIKSALDYVVHPEDYIGEALDYMSAWQRGIQTRLDIEYPISMQQITARAESSANVIIGGEHVSWEDYAKALATQIETNLVIRATKVKDAAISIWDILSGQKATAPKKTLTSTRLLISSLGADPYEVGSWPCPELAAANTIPEIQFAYAVQAQKTLAFWRAELGTSDRGLFLDACVKEISLHAADMFCAAGGVITESLDTTSLIYIHALEAGLSPPAGTPPDVLEAWHDYIVAELDYYDIPTPNLSLLTFAYSRFF